MNPIEETYLDVRWTTSRGRDTYGYNICTIEDMNTNKRFRCMGGGYDMRGSSFGEWIQETYQDRLLAIAKRAYTIGISPSEWTHDGELYGMAWYQYGDRVVLDGAAGESSMVKIAQAIGINVKHTIRKGKVTGYIISAS